MITHEITRKYTPPSFLRQVKDVARQALGYSPSQRVYSGGSSFMEKIDYAKWVEGIKERYPKGSRWTFASTPPRPGKEPLSVYVVQDVVEIHWNAPMDSVHDEPRCVYVISERYPTVPILYCPKALRPLTEEELQLVRIRNQAEAPEEPTETVVNEDGGFEVLDANGKVIRSFS